MRENEVQARALLAAGAVPGVRLFRNTVGEGWHGKVVQHDGELLVLRHPRRVTFGLCPGSPDLVGWRPLLITPDMVGLTIAQFAGLEVKGDGGRERDNQTRFLTVLRGAGGLAETVRSPEEARKAVIGTGGGIR